MAVKLFVSDLDGTMLPNGNVVSAENIAAVQCAVRAGITVTIATGRMFEAALPVAEALGVDVPIIAYNGALIKSPSGHVYEEYALDPSLARDIISFAQARGWYIQSYSRGVLRYAAACEESRFYEDSQKIAGEAVGQDGMFAHLAGNCKLLLVTEGRDVSEARAQEILGAFGAHIDVTRSADRLVEIECDEFDRHSFILSASERVHPHPCRAHTYRLPPQGHSQRRTASRSPPPP